MGEIEKTNESPPLSKSDGLSYTQMLELDTRDVPDFLMEESQIDLGNEPLSTERYTSQSYADLEAEKMWPNVWQFVAIVDEITV